MPTGIVKEVPVQVMEVDVMAQVGEQPLKEILGRPKGRVGWEVSILRVNLPETSGRLPRAEGLAFCPSPCRSQFSQKKENSGLGGAKGDTGWQIPGIFMPTSFLRGSRLLEPAQNSNWVSPSSLSAHSKGPLLANGTEPKADPLLDVEGVLPSSPMESWCHGTSAFVF